MSNTFFNIFPNENFIDLCMYQLDTNSVIPVILSDLQHATTICFTTFFPEPERLWQTMQRGYTDLFRKKRTGIYDFPGADQYLHCR